MSHCFCYRHTLLHCALQILLFFFFFPQIEGWWQASIVRWWLTFLAIKHFKIKVSVSQFSRSVMSDSLRPHESQHSRPPCPSLTPGVHSNSCLLVIASSHLILCCPLLLLPPIPPSIRASSNESTLRMRWPKYWISALASFLPMNTQDWSPLGWTGLISLQSKGLLRVFSSTTVQRHQFCGILPSLWFSSHNPMWPLRKPSP